MDPKNITNLHGFLCKLALDKIFSCKHCLIRAKSNNFDWDFSEIRSLGCAEPHLTNAVSLTRHVIHMKKKEADNQAQIYSFPLVSTWHISSFLWCMFDTTLTVFTDNVASNCAIWIFPVVEVTAACIPGDDRTVPVSALGLTVSETLVAERPTCSVQAVLKIRTICHARELWNLARSCEQLPLLCLPVPWNLPGTALPSGFQSSCGASKSAE